MWNHPSEFSSNLQLVASDMKIGIHHRPDSFSDYWIKYCKENQLSFKLVNCYASDIVEQLKDCEALLWHWSYWDSKAILYARNLIHALEESGKKVYPNSRTCWNYDDKIGQKYLFEALNIESIPTWTFYDKKSAYQWLEKTTFPKVFKLKGGASAHNVKLVKTKRQARSLIKKAFGKGFSVSARWNKLNDRILLFKREKSKKSFIHLLKGFYRLFYERYDIRMRSRDKGYVYFQEFIPGNDYDIRLVVIGNRCVGMIRYNRKDDFRASGSGKKSYDPNLIDKTVIAQAFAISEKLNVQSVAFDFIRESNNYKLVEISYTFVSKKFPGYWDRDLNWHEGEVKVPELILEDFIKSF